MKKVLIVLMVLLASVFAVAVTPTEVTSTDFGPVRVVGTATAAVPNKKVLSPTAITGAGIKVLGYPTDLGGGEFDSGVAKSESLQTTAAGAGGTVAPEVVTSVKAISITPFRSSIIAETETASGTVFREIAPKEVSAVSYNNISIRPSFDEKKVLMDEDGVQVSTTSTVEVNDNLYIKSADSKQKITITPVQAQAIIVGKANVSPAVAAEIESAVSIRKVAPSSVTGISTLSLEVEGGKPIYTATATKKGKFLFVLPVEYTVEVKVDAQTGTSVVNKPFWSALVVD